MHRFQKFGTGPVPVPIEIFVCQLQAHGQNIGSDFRGKHLVEE